MKGNKERSKEGRKKARRQAIRLVTSVACSLPQPCRRMAAHCASMQQDAHALDLPVCAYVEIHVHGSRHASTDKCTHLSDLVNALRAGGEYFHGFVQEHINIIQVIHHSLQPPIKSIHATVTQHNTAQFRSSQHTHLAQC